MLRVLEFRSEYRVGKEPVDWVLIAPLGPDFEKTQTWKRVEKMRPPANADENTKESLTFKDMEAKWSIIGPAYAAFKEGSELPENGTPLEAWQGVTKEQAKFLKAQGVASVEDVAQLGDAALEKLNFPNARRLPELAKKWLDGASVAQKDAEIAEMKEQMAIMREMLEEKAQDKPRRGRPPKAKVEDAAA